MLRTGSDPRTTGMAKGQKIRLGILFGGRSGEHEVSLTSAASVIGALDASEFEITAIGIRKDGRLASRAEVKRMLPPHVQDRIALYDALEGGDSRIRLTSTVSNGRHQAPALPEIIFPLLHGPYGEDGTIQGLLEIAGLPYIGCGVLASAVGMDKDVAKRLFKHEGLPVVPYRVVSSKEVARRTESLKRAVAEEFGYPVFSKPANLGSSVGVRKINSEKEFDEGVRFSARFDRKILIEKGIDARELECAVLGNDDAEASPVGEVIPSREFYDYFDKYFSPDSRLEIPARIPEKKSAEVQDIALRAFRAIDGAGLARVDFFMERRSGKIWLNEINTMPGFTPISMYPKLWAAKGVPFEELVRRLVRFALDRHHERSEHKIGEE
jgi:D-alanine-D-alanine ligase